MAYCNWHDGDSSSSLNLCPGCGLKFCNSCASDSDYAGSSGVKCPKCGTWTHGRKA